MSSSRASRQPRSRSLLASTPAFLVSANWLEIRDGRRPRGSRDTEDAHAAKWRPSEGVLHIGQLEGRSAGHGNQEESGQKKRESRLLEPPASSHWQSSAAIDEDRPRSGAMEDSPTWRMHERQKRAVPHMPAYSIDSVWPKGPRGEGRQGVGRHRHRLVVLESRVRGRVEVEVEGEDEDSRSARAGEGGKQYAGTPATARGERGGRGEAGGDDETRSRGVWWTGFGLWPASGSLRPPSSVLSSDPPMVDLVLRVTKVDSSSLAMDVCCKVDGTPRVVCALSEICF
ncbi:hypothetical protein QBC39DRAFT_330631 [Podospora conica]|nr:hypothetical protein QBC39DRAFT_330631 [Schizothecium conicum]